MSGNDQSYRMGVSIWIAPILSRAISCAHFSSRLNIRCPFGYMRKCPRSLASS